MSPLDARINHARQRLTANILLQRLSAGILVAAALWALLIVVTRLFSLPIPIWHAAWIAALAALLIGLITTARVRPTPLYAAVTLDRAAGLKERLSTALVVRKADDPFARATVNDAEREADKVHVPSRIPRQWPPLWPWSAATVCVALILAQFMPAVDLFAADADLEASVPREQVEAERAAINTELQKRLDRIKEMARDNPNLKGLADGIEPIDMPDDPGVTPEDIRRDAVKRIDDVRDRLKRELDEDSKDQLKQLRSMLNKMKPQTGSEAGAKLSQSLAAGDFKGAKNALQEMMKEMQEAAKNADDPAAKQKLAKMQQQLGKLADQIAKLSDSMQLQKELENKAGLSEEQAKKLLEQLSKMDPKQVQKELQKQLGDKGLSQKQIQQIAKKIQQNKQAQKTAQQLAQSLAKAAQGCQQCNQPGGSSSGSAQAANALADAAGQLSQMEMSQQLMNELESQLSDLENMRDSVCQGGMCPNGGQGKRPGRVGRQGGNAGLGLGARIGKERTAYQRDPTKAKTRFEGGEIIGTMLVDGPQIRGAASAEALDAAESELRDAQDAIERNEIPRQYRRVLQEYFERLAGLVGEKQADAEPDAADAEPTDG